MRILEAQYTRPALHGGCPNERDFGDGYFHRYLRTYPILFRMGGVEVAGDLKSDATLHAMVI